MSFPGNPSLKNAGLSPAATSLGLGDQLQTQLQNTLDEDKKKKQTDQAAGGLNPNSPGIGAAVQSLLGNTGGM